MIGLLSKNMTSNRTKKMRRRERERKKKRNKDAIEEKRRMSFHFVR